MKIYDRFLFVGVVEFAYGWNEGALQNYFRRDAIGCFNRRQLGMLAASLGMLAESVARVQPLMPYLVRAW